MSHLVVPDLIEPVAGWKQLTVDENGNLRSPMFAIDGHWPHKQRYEASCVDAPPLRWQLRDNRYPIEVDFSHHASFVPAPPYPAPEGKYWWFGPYLHNGEIDETCSCGIYAVKTPKLTQSYVDSNRVLVKVALWGKVITASYGYRAEFAYPQAIFARKDNPHNEKIWDSIEKAAANYGIPIVENGPLLLPVQRVGGIVPEPGKPRKTVDLVLSGFMAISAINLTTAAIRQDDLALQILYSAFVGVFAILALASFLVWLTGVKAD